jgi:hypothetical protein
MYNYPTCEGENIRYLTAGTSNDGTNIQSAEKMGVNILSIDGFECDRINLLDNEMAS